MMDEIDDNLKERIEKALKDKEIPNIHFNGFINSLGTGDVLIILERNGQPIAVLNTSYTVAKTLSQKLGGIMTVLEQKTGNTIMTVDEIKTKMGEPGDLK